MHRPGASAALTLKMVVAGVLTPLIVVAAVLGLVLGVDSWRLRGALAVAVVIGVAVALEERNKRVRTRTLSSGEAPELHGALERLCLQANLAKPLLVLAYAETQPNSWVIDVPGRTPRLHVTRGLLELLTPAEIEAVLAHELAHIAHRDATVMTVVGMPGMVLLQGGRRLCSQWTFLFIGGMFAWLIGALASVGTNSLARTRELAADATAARLTGRPAALSSALLKVSGEIARLPVKDLRAGATLNAFNLLPVRGPQRKGLGGRIARSRPGRALASTHPSLPARLAALERLEGEQRRLSLRD